MTNLLLPPAREKLWHRMRHDLASYAPAVAGTRLLMCCACGRFLAQERFDLEHLIPQQALRRDPDLVRINPVTPANVRAKNILLCKEPLRHRGTTVYKNGCNSWKGRFYDRRISDLFFGDALEPTKLTDVHIISALCLAYLAMVAEFGYIIALMQSGLTMRRQFFSPHKFVSNMPLASQMVLGGDLSAVPADDELWAKPFSFTFENSACFVGMRNLVIKVPITRDPRAPLARYLRIVPAQYKMHPNFRTVFD
jgi:hypothetical protein